MARELMSEPFYWSRTEFNTPFGTEGGRDALKGYAEWQKQNPGKDPYPYLDKLLIQMWDYPPINFYERDPIKAIARMRGDQYNPRDILEDMDHAIIGVAFAKLVLEGELTYKIQQMAIAALERQTHIKMESRHSPAQWQDRKEKYAKMRALLASFDIRPPLEEARAQLRATMEAH